MKSRILLLIGLVAILLFGSFGFIVIKGNTDQAARKNANATATAQAIRTNIAKTKTTATANPYPPYGGTLLLNAPLRENTKNPAWDEGSTPNYGFCQFTGGAYHLEVSSSSLTL